MLTKNQEDEINTIRNKMVAELTFKPAGVLAMAPMSDKRQAITDVEKYDFETSCDEFEDE